MPTDPEPHSSTPPDPQPADHGEIQRDWVSSPDGSPVYMPGPRGHTRVDAPEESDDFGPVIIALKSAALRRGATTLRGLIEAMSVVNHNYDANCKALEEIARQEGSEAARRASGRVEALRHSNWDAIMAAPGVRELETLCTALGHPFSTDTQRQLRAEIRVVHKLSEQQADSLRIQNVVDA